MSAMMKLLPLRRPQTSHASAKGPSGRAERAVQARNVSPMPKRAARKAIQARQVEMSLNAEEALITDRIEDAESPRVSQRCPMLGDDVVQIRQLLGRRGLQTKFARKKPNLI